MRLDKYLKVSRLIKRRTVANEACDAGKVLVNDKPARASYDVKIDDVITITLGARTYSVTVTEFTPDAELAAAVLDTISAVKPGENNTTSGTSAAETVPNGCAKHDYNDWDLKKKQIIAL